MQYTHKEISTIVKRVSHILEHIDNAIKLIDLKIDSPGLEYVFAIDFYDLNQFAFPNRSYLLQLFEGFPKNIDSLDQVISTLRSETNSMELILYHGILRQVVEFSENNFILLPPYLDELTASLRFYYRSKKYNSRRDKLKALSIQFLGDPNIENIFKKYNENKTLDADDVEILKEIVINNYFELISLSSITSINGDLTINHLIEINKLIKEPETIPIVNEIWRKLVHRKTKEKDSEFEKWFAQLNELKPNKRLANYIDAQALQYLTLFNDQALNAYNNNSVDNRYVMFLLSSAEAITEVSKLGRCVILESENCLDSFVIHPETLFWLNINKDSESLNESRRKLIGLKESATAIVSMHKEKEKTKHAYSNIKNGNETELFKSWEDNLFSLIKSYWRHINISAYADTIERMQQRMVGKPEITQNEISHISELFLNALPSQLDISDYISNIDNEVVEKISIYLESSGVLTSLWGFALHPKNASYIFRIEDQELAKLENVIFGEDTGEIDPRVRRRVAKKSKERTAMFSALNQLKAITKQRDNADAFYLSAHILEKTNNFKQALKFIKIGKDICDKKRFKKNSLPYQRLCFLQNMVWIRNKNFDEAVDQAKELADEPFKVTPKFKIQLGYIYWRKYRLEIIQSHDSFKTPQYRVRYTNQAKLTLTTCIETFYEAYEISKRKNFFNEFRRCRRLVIADLVITNSEADNLDEANIYLEKLELELTKLHEKRPHINYDYIPVFIAAKASVPWCEAKIVLEQLKDKELYVTDEMKIQNTLQKLDFEWTKLQAGIERTDSDDSRKDLMDLLENITKTRSEVRALITF